MGPILRLLGGALLAKGGAAIANRLRGGPPPQPDEPERTKRGGAPKRPEHVAKQMADTSLASIFRDLKAGPRSRPVDLEQYDESALRRKLGTPNPSPEQIQTERGAIDSRNEAKVEQEKERFKKSLKKVTGTLLKMGIGAGLAIHAFNRLAKVVNKLDLEKLRMFSPQIAQAAAQREIFDMRQNAQLGQLTGGSTTALSQQMMQLDRARQPYQALLKNVMNDIKSVFVAGEIKFLEALEAVGIRQLVDDVSEIRNYGKDADGPNQLLTWLRQRGGGGPVNVPLVPSNMRPNEQPGGRIQ